MNVDSMIPSKLQFFGTLRRFTGVYGSKEEVDLKWAPLIKNAATNSLSPRPSQAAMELLLLPSRPFPPSLPPSSSPPSTSSSPQCSRRETVLKIGALTLISTLVPATKAETLDSSSPAPVRKPLLPGIASTKSWFLYIGDGFSIRVPPSFDDVTEPEDFNAGLSLYGDKVKPKTFAAQFASPDRSEVVSVVVRPSNQLKITFLEAKDITDLGTLKEASKIFVPGNAKLYSARAIKIKEDEGLRGYYFYEFGVNDQRLALVAAVNSGKTIIAAAAAPDTRWEEDGIKLRSAAISLSVA